jgi:hypothetical protein
LVPCVSSHVYITNIIFRRLLQLEVSQITGTETVKRQADFEDKCTSLRNQIYQWREIQLVYMPCTTTLHAQSIVTPTTASSPSIERAESIPLYLPSSLPPHIRQLPEISTLLDRERRLRIAQADESLADIRRQRRIISGLWQFKKTNVDGTGNKTSTRMRTLYDRFNLRTKRCAMRYRAARGALLVIDPLGSWQSRLKDLKDNDIRGPGKDDNGTRNSRFEPSWIWMVPRIISAPDMEDSEMALDESLQVEWAKCRARKERWEEEVLIIQEEMRRVIAYQLWRAQWWLDQRGRRANIDGATLQGIAAYAEKQANLCEALAYRCGMKWLPGLKAKGITPDWADVIETLSTVHAAIVEDIDEDDEESDEELDELVDKKLELNEAW